ncbi:hypothetical protein [Thioclava indica]|uniref:hypothetical protein n=1 Tax=Thioclava indica TaxID=1353528 RepID=UPI000AF76849|nr:hypothetical protein [Thioclava indica]
MRAICHIGHHKTGTTSLQAFLSCNSPSLLKAGILYPWVESQGAAFAVASAAGRLDPPEVLPINIREAHNALAFRMLADSVESWKVPPYHTDLPHSRQMLLALNNQIEAIRPDHVVLCSEVMSQFGKVAKGQISRLRGIGLVGADEITIWCTLRRPDEQLVSWHGQQIRFGQAPAPLSDSENGLNLNWLHFDYRGVLEPWLDEIPEAKIVLRPYAETLAEGGSVKDFLKHAGIQFPKQLRPVPRMNVSLKPAVLTLMREANLTLSRPAARELAQVLPSLTERYSLAGSSEVELLGQRSRDRLLKSFLPIHDWLSEMSGRQAFFTDLDEMSRCRPIPEREALRQLLDQISPDLFTHMEHAEVGEFIAGLCSTFRP